jgi:inner membrane protein
MAPDLDVFIHFKENPMSSEIWHRNFTHSLVFMPLGGLLVFLFFLCFPPFRKHWKITLGAALIGYATHGLLDALTSYGTLLLWPFSSTRISWDIISIVDPLFTIFLTLGTAWSVIFKEQRGVMISIFCASLMLLFNTLQHQRAIQSLQAYSSQNQLNLKQVRAVPSLASSTNWRVVAKSAHCLYILDSDTPIFKKTSISLIAKLPLFTGPKFPLGLKQAQELKTFLWFIDNYAIIAKQKPFTLADGRYIFGLNSLYSLWGIELFPHEEHVNKIRNIILNDRCSY